ncbi:hypothetical protein PGT21_011230 [Puccinia graminis f. sp. tritici]|uniref:Uncharacterized protein n=2 Tax=Puccinia graminis f. sp. tritici TaxID=56615 RepID=E3K1T5_PUCGT|nr:uncharacterized protein PGTG_04216 [Puccinia graminis f. sp. tritici CRL 75-36-700-3]EFP78260.1 hypothetical protein PGTG_04216 [Puccinia graminis f. sp. tritici CRL 75-36-700-3]KAA1112806.1 hypothetical protein PGT21_011230 [Puccinia graminis f. sp. tritici]
MPPDLETNFGRQPRGLPYVDTKGTVHLLVLWLLIFEGQQEITHSALVITRWSSNAISISSAQYQFHKFNSGYQWLRPKDNRSVFNLTPAVAKICFLDFQRPGTPVEMKSNGGFGLIE